MRKVFSVFLICSLCIITGCAKSAQQYYEAAEKYLTAGQYDKAIENFQQALKIDAKNVDIYSGLAEAYQLSGDNDSWVSALEQEVDVFPDDAGAYGKLAAAYLKTGNNDKYTSTLATAIEKCSDNAQSYIDLAAMLKDMDATAVYYQVLKDGYTKTKSADIKALLSEKVTLQEKNLAIVYDTLLNSGKFIPKPSDYQYQYLSGGTDYLFGASDYTDSLTIDTKDVLSSPIDGVYTSVYHRFFINKYTDSKNGKTEYKFATICDYRNGNVGDNGFKMKECRFGYFTSTLTDSVQLYYHEDDNNYHNDFIYYTFLNGQLTETRQDTREPVSDLLTEDYININIEIVNRVLKPFNLSFDDIMDRNAVYYYLMYDTTL